MSTGKKAKPTYFNAILGVALVLFLLGVLGWLLINGRALSFSDACGRLASLRRRDTNDAASELYDWGCCPPSLILNVISLSSSPP